MNSRQATSCGILAVLLWACMAPTVAFAKGVHPFLFTAIEHGLGFFGFLLQWAVTRRYPLPELKSVPLWLYAAAFIGIPVHQVCWVAAVQQAPPLEATLIIYTWPLLVVIFTAISLRHKLKWHHFAGALLGFAGVITMLLGRGLGDMAHFTWLPGHSFAVVASLSWSIFAAIATRQSRLTSSYLAVVFAVSSIVNFCLWFFYMDAPAAPKESLMIAGAVLLFISNGYALWDYGMKKGNTRLIAIFSFMTPVLAAFYLVALGKGDMNAFLFAALLLVMSGIGVAKYGDTGKAGALS